MPENWEIQMVLKGEMPHSGQSPGAAAGARGAPHPERSLVAIMIEALEIARLRRTLTADGSGSANNRDLLRRSALQNGVSKDRAQIFLAAPLGFPLLTNGS